MSAGHGTRERVRMLLTTTFLVAVGGSAVPQAEAQEAPAASDGMVLAPIVVTGQGETATGPVQGFVAKRSASATKTDTPLIETPQSISIVTKDQIEATDAETLSQALAYTPGITFQSGAYSRLNDDFMIRGFNVAAGGSGMLRDGLRLQSNVYDGNQEPYGLERVDVLRGPSSVLYGQLSPGGVVNAISKQPTDVPFHELNAEYGTYGRTQFSGDTGGPIDDNGMLSYRLTGLWRDSGNSVDHVPDDKFYIAPAFTFRPSDATTITFLSDYQEIYTRFAPPMPYNDLRNDRVPRDLFIGQQGYDKYYSESYTLGYQFEHKFNDSLILRNSLRYFHADVAWDYLSYGKLRDDNSLIRGVVNRNEVSNGFTTDTSLEAKVETGPVQHTLLAGIDTYGVSYDTDRLGGSVAPLGDIYDPVYDAHVNVNTNNTGFKNSGSQVGVYVQDQMKIYDKLILVLGGRYDWADSYNTSYRNQATLDFLGIDRKQSRSDSAFTGRVGLLYLFDNGFAPYASFSQSFQPTALNAGVSQDGKQFEPTKADQYEVGLRYQPAGENLTLSGALFRINQNHVLTADPSDPTGTYSIQTGEVRSQGIELEARASIGALNLVAAYSYTDARNEKGDLEGERLALVPYHNVAVWADYKLDDLGIKGLTVGAGLQYLSSTNLPGFDANDEKIDKDVPGHLVADAMIAYDFGAIDERLTGTTLQVNAKNLFDNEYMTCVDITGCRYGEPFTLSAKLGYRW
ncbi:MULTISPECIES: TonB-dependent siderophore receptor [Inquilinus]|uniref:Iron complex outermembrane receptor protein n=1 Tax=Inquilinus ginsengisoli TaxID=363840 RepID=A0ABU1JGT6_9PROT|nr:TonB-dependent siderophore receptor [Inquilinus ginsengisoli]MDR6287830.1 iron complex outermembrane receptor protein [Inquilinus ginsengisoli]